MRRNQLIALTLAAPPVGATVLLIAGAAEANAFDMPPGVDCLTLPALGKQLDGRYCARRLSVSLDDLIALRSRTIQSALDSFAPDLLIVDKLPRGAFHELDRALASLRAGGRTRCVLGLRDVLDEPEVVRKEWADAGSVEAIRSFYSAVWIYGDPTVYDPLTEYLLPTDVAEMARFCGYLDSRARLAGADVAWTPSTADPPSRWVLCQVGGGQDGARLAEAFAHAELPEQTGGILLTGPYMPAEARAELQRQAASERRLQIIEFMAEPTALLHRVDRVISMGGYNTVCELLCHEKAALIVPRTRPRREQLIRAERLRDLGAIEMLLPETIDPTSISEWLHREVAPPVGIRERIDLCGLRRIPYLAHEVMSTRP